MSRKKRSYVGTVQKNPRGFAFILPESSEIEDAYVDRREAMPLMNGDQVEFYLTRRRGRLSAKIVKILERGQKRIVGKIVEHQQEFYLRLPDTQFFLTESPHHETLREGVWAIATIKTYPSQKSDGLATLVRILGDTLSPKDDIPIAISQFQLPDTFSLEIRRELGRLKVPKNDSRKDLTNIGFVTIDGADAKDFDDAVAVVRPKKGKTAFILYVAIADVSAFVLPGSKIDEEAEKRSTSVYFPGMCLPMLPEKLSNDLCSLKPKVERLAFTAEMHFDRDGNIQKSRFYESTIKTQGRLTYEEVHRCFKPGAKRHRLAPQLDNLRALYKKLAQRRSERGVLEFDLPECQIELNRLGLPKKLARAPRYESHKMIEEFMIAANSAVAKKLRQAQQPALYRIHEAPDGGALDEIRGLMKRLGISKTFKQNNPKAYSKLLSQTVDMKGGLCLHTFVLRQQKQACYHPEPLGHFGLALKDYTHFTSPIRRYPDLLVHRALKRVISTQRSSDKGKDRDYFIEMGIQCSKNERRAMEAERFVVRKKQCWFMQNYIDQAFPALVKWVSVYGLHVEIPEFALEGFLPSEALDGYFEYDDQRLCFVKRPGHTKLSVGDPLSVWVSSVSVEENEILLSQVAPS